MNRTARILAVACALTLAGCITQITRQDERKLGDFGFIGGTASAERPDAGPVVVVFMLYRDGRYWSLRDRVIPAGKGGKFEFPGRDGEYALWAFQDHNRDLIAQPTEPATVPDNGSRFTLQGGDNITGVQIRVPARGRPAVLDELGLAGATEPTALDPKLVEEFSIRISKGDVVSLDDPRFQLDQAAEGMLRPMQYLEQRGTGIYFLEAYDPRRVPVLFVHGMSGSPQNFSSLIERLDRGRFQPWVFHYPSGFDLDVVADSLSNMVSDLHAVHGFDRLLVVAHSMGGLVSRSFILRHDDPSYLRLFVSISTPWGGMSSASDTAKAQKAGLAFPASWLDVAPGSAFLTSLYFSDPTTLKRRRSLPRHARFHLFFGFAGAAGPLPGVTVQPSDRTVELRSQLAPVVQDEARSRYGFPLDHVQILHSVSTAERLNEILAGAAG